jgi:hypothetical protein
MQIGRKKPEFSVWLMLPGNDWSDKTAFQGQTKNARRGGENSVKGTGYK